MHHPSKLPILTNSYKCQDVMGMYGIPCTKSPCQECFFGTHTSQIFKHPILSSESLVYIEMTKCCRKFEHALKLHQFDALHLLLSWKIYSKIEFKGFFPKTSGLFKEV